MIIITINIGFDPDYMHVLKTIWDFAEHNKVVMFVAVVQPLTLSPVRMWLSRNSVDLFRMWLMLSGHTESLYSWNWSTIKMWVINWNREICKNIVYYLRTTKNVGYLLKSSDLWNMVYFIVELFIYLVTSVFKFLYLLNLIHVFREFSHKLCVIISEVLFGNLLLRL